MIKNTKIWIAAVAQALCLGTAVAVVSRSPPYPSTFNPLQQRSLSPSSSSSSSSSAFLFHQSLSQKTYTTPLYQKPCSNISSKISSSYSKIKTSDHCSSLSRLCMSQQQNSNKNSNNDDDDDEYNIDNKESLENSIINLFSMSQGRGLPSSSSSSPDSTIAGSNAPPPDPLYNIREGDLDNELLSEGSIGDQDDDAYNFDAPYLDAELYSMSSNMMNPDGSLDLSKRQQQQQQQPDGDYGVGGRNGFNVDNDFTTKSFADGIQKNNNNNRRRRNAFGDDEVFKTLSESIMTPPPQMLPNNDDYYLENPYRPSADDEQTFQTLLSAFQKRSNQQNDRKNVVSEELHRQVFENEEGFLKQSEAFRRWLSGDSTAGLEDDDDEKKEEDPVALRRGVEYRKKQEEALAKLEQEMDDFLNMTLDGDDDDDDSNEIREEKSDNGGNPLSATNPSTETNQVVIKCEQCGTRLLQDEIEHSKNMPADGKICRLCFVDVLQKAAAKKRALGQGQGRDTYVDDDKFGYGLSSLPFQSSSPPLRQQAFSRDGRVNRGRQDVQRSTNAFQRRETSFDRQRNRPSSVQQQQQQRLETRNQSRKQQNNRNIPLKSSPSPNTRNNATKNQQQRQQQRQQNGNKSTQESRENSTAIQRLENEVKKYKARAETAEKEIDALRDAVKGLEEALNAAISSQRILQKDDAVENEATTTTTPTSSTDDKDKSGVNEKMEIKDMWIDVVDPDTGNIFYWNEETGEMRWEL